MARTGTIYRAKKPNSREYYVMKLFAIGLRFGKKANRTVPEEAVFLLATKPEIWYVL